MTTPDPPIRPAPRPPRRARAGAIALVLLFACGPARSEGASSGATDSLTVPPSGAPAGPSATTPFATPRPVGGVLRADRGLHASLALAIGTGVGLASREPAAGAGTALVLAVAKELLDDRFDRGDLAAGAVGAGLAWLVVSALTR